MSRVSRRTFLGAAAAGASCLTLGAGRSYAADANSEIGIGLIGIGGRGKQVGDQFKRLPGVRLVSLCDADEAHLNQYAQDLPGAHTTTDLREVLDNTAVDAVIITTPNHWHCLAGLWALQKKKHVYVEKPLGHNVWEGRQLVNAAAQSDRVVAIGTQQRSDPMQAEIKAFLHEEKQLGEPQYVHACRYGIRESIGKRDAPLTPPSSLDYDLWLGPAAEEPIYRQKLHYDWHWNFNTGSGEMGNWGVHILDDVRNVALLDEHNLPSSVFACGGREVWNDAGTTPNVHLACYQTPTIPVYLGLSNLPRRPGARRSISEHGVESGYLVYCSGGYYAGWRGGGEAFDLEGKSIRKFRGDSGAGHAANFIKAIRENNASLLNAPVETGHHSTNWCHLANIAYRCGGEGTTQQVEAAGEGHAGWLGLVNKMQDHLAAYDLSLSSKSMQVSPVLTVDSSAEQFTGEGAGDANALLRREYREGYEVPETA